MSTHKQMRLIIVKSKEDIKKQQKDELFKLLSWVGNQAQLARQLNVSRQVVAGWVKRGRIAAKYATEVERKTNGLFKRDDLRPDVFEWFEKP